MPELNEDGLVPGQQVDFETIRKVEAERAKKQTETIADKKPARGVLNAKQKDASTD